MYSAAVAVRIQRSNDFFFRPCRDRRTVFERDEVQNLGQPAFGLEAGVRSRQNGLSGLRFWRNEEVRFAWLSLLPALVFFAVFVGFPMAYALYLSFNDWNMTAPSPNWVGLENYAALFDDELFVRSLLQTTLFTLGITACIVVFSLVVALLIDQKLRLI